MFIDGCFFFQAEDGIRDLVRSRGLGDVYKRQIIDISDLKLYKKDGTLVKDFGDFYKEYKEEFKADASCWCSYWNANLMLKDFNTYLIEKIRTDMTGVELE